MKMFFLVVLSAYLSLVHEMGRLKWNATRINSEINLNCPSLRKKSFLNRIIRFSLKKKSGQYQYIYYAKKILILVAILLVPWFWFVYVYEWYSIKPFLLAHIIMSVFLCSAPTNIFNAIYAIYERKKKTGDG